MSTGGAAVLAWTGTTVTALAGLSLLASGLLAGSRAETAADLAALAAADAHAVGRNDPCGLAAEAARRNGARLLGCTADGEDVRVRVAVAAAPLGEATARARAGPERR